MLFFVNQCTFKKNNNSYTDFQAFGDFLSRMVYTAVMDATVRPLRIPPEMAIYAEKHDIFHLVQV